jgi:hypothetical protein
MSADAKIAVFEDSIVIPALAEMTSAPSLQRDFAADMVMKRPLADAKSEELLSTIATTFRKRTGPSVVLTDRKAPAGIAAIGGRYAMSVLYDVQGDEVYASPGVMFWMAFNNKLHGFAHRYDNAIARHRVEDITRVQVLNHVLNSLTFYKVQAYSPAPFPGYR